MTAQMLEGALRHANGPTIEQVQMAMVTANYITAASPGPMARSGARTERHHLGGRSLHELPVPHPLVSIHRQHQFSR